MNKFIITEEEKARILNMHKSKSYLMEEKGELIQMKSEMAPHKGLIAQGYKGESGWEEKLAKVVGHARMYKFDGDAVGALKASSNKDLSKTDKDIHTVTFTNGDKKVTYIGID